MTCCDTSLRHPVHSRWFYNMRTGIPWVILWLNGRFSFTHSNVPHITHQKSRIPGGPHNFIMAGFVTGLKYLTYFQWRYIDVQRTGTPLFKSNRHCFAMSNDDISCQRSLAYVVENIISVWYTVTLGWAFKFGKVREMRCQYSATWIKIWRCFFVVRHDIYLWVIFLV